MEEKQLTFYRETMREQKQSNCFREDKTEAEKLNSRTARKVENWMEKRTYLPNFVDTATGRITKHPKTLQTSPHETHSQQKYQNPTYLTQFSPKTIPQKQKFQRTKHIQSKNTQIQLN
ncbi:hypothetical protein VIGAN_04260200 [Vigna angularis var. angularis]|uniref:Uncharacterized protein n=1 Tax=Vigna angularis var. angularis TaxID=157739 RepID=A0A0S3RWX4_PHAAN|nr:hypothetical protein VIGAN_04260200 [Vigna angularis var. angularis]